jgi:glycosyltransferase involved in cell wall biosynthesis
MRVLLISNTYAPVLGGVQTVTHHLAQHLLKRGHQVQVVTNRYPRSLSDEQTLDGVSIHRLLLLSPNIDSLQRKRPDLFVASCYFYPLSFWRLQKLMRGFRPEVVNVHFPEHQIPFVLALRRRFSFRLIVSLHGHDIERVQSEDSATNSRKDPIATGRLRLILREADAVTACSQHLLDQAIRVEPSIAGKGHVIHNGIDPERFADKSFHLHPRPYVFAFGRLTHKKGFDMLLQAFARAAPATQEVDLIIAGEGEERNALERQAQQLDVASRVHFFERATPQEVVRLINGSRFVVVPSRREPFGIVALEALAAGKPLLATKTGGLAEFLTEVKRKFEQSPKSSFAPAPVITLVDPTVEELATGLRQFFDFPANHSGEVSDYHIIDEYGWAAVTRRYETVLVGKPA